MNYSRIISEEIGRFLILEDRYTIPDNRRAISYMKKNGIGDDEAKRIIDILMHDFGITNSKNPKMFFMVGLSRLYIKGELRDESSFRTINGLLPFMLKPDNFSQFQNSENGHDFNGMSLSEISQAFGTQAKEASEKERNEIESARYQSKGYNIVKIDTFEEASRYAKYTKWCITQEDDNFESYNLSDANQCYFCLKKGFERVPYPSDPKAAGAPFDEYGLSMISVIVDENGKPAHVTTRYNHDFDGEDNDGLKTAKQVSETVGVNFFETFKPSNKFKEAVEEATRRLANGEDPNEVFDYCGEFHEGYAKIKLNGKWNFIGNDGKYLSEQWFDNCNNFIEGYASVSLNRKWNFIGKDGKYVSDKWFDGFGYFIEGYATVELNGNWNFIGKDGKYASDKWFNWCDNFRNGYAKVEADNKWNFIGTDGKGAQIGKDMRYLSSQWFDRCYDFMNGCAAVKLNGKWNFIGNDGKYLSEQWFDNCGVFVEGYAAVRLNGKWNFIGKDGKGAQVGKGMRYLSDRWFDNCYNFSEGYAKIELNGKWLKIDKQGNLHGMNESRSKRAKRIISEEIRKVFSESITKKNIGRGRTITFTRPNPSSAFRSIEKFIKNLSEKFPSSFENISYDSRFPSVKEKIYTYTSKYTKSSYLKFVLEGVSYEIRFSNHTKPDASINVGGIRVNSKEGKIIDVEMDFSLEDELNANTVKRIIEEIERFNKKGVFYSDESDFPLLSHFGIMETVRFQNKIGEKYENMENTRKQSESYQKYIDSNKIELLPKYVLSNGVTVFTNGSYDYSKWIAFKGDKRLTKRDGKRERNEAFSELRSILKDGIMTFEQWKESLVS